VTQGQLVALIDPEPFQARVNQARASLDSARAAVMNATAVAARAEAEIAVYQPITEKLYYAASDSGAFLIENRASRLLRVSPQSNPTAMTIALSRSHHSSDVDDIQRRLGINNTVCSGSMGLKVGLICEGAHICICTQAATRLSGTLAPDVILREAAGRMTDLFNAPLRHNGPEVRNLRGVIASNGTIHERVAEAAQAELTRRL
jgi:3'-phosphoadenosine 5'-phosphosulfate (PAPS) 3'-phosphatase